MRAIVTAIGKDTVGIIASLCSLLASYGVNVLDISQTVMQSYFTMIMMVDTSGCSVDFKGLSEALSALGRDLSVDVRIQREDIFEAMHRI